MLQPCYAAPSLAAFKAAAGEAYRGFQVIAVDEAQFFPGAGAPPPPPPLPLLLLMLGAPRH